MPRPTLDEIFGEQTAVSQPQTDKRPTLDEIFGEQSSSSPASTATVTQPTQKKSPKEAWLDSHPWMKTVVDGYKGNIERTKGFVKEAGSLGYRLGGLGANIGGAMSNGVNRLRGVESPSTNEPGFMDTATNRPEILTPQNDQQKQGAMVENLAEFAVPNPFKVAKAPSAISKAGKALGFGEKVIAEGLEQGVRSAVQKGDAKDIGTDTAIGAAFPVAGAALKGAGRLAGEALGLTTGAGYGAIRQAFRDTSPEFKRALRGNVDDTMTEVLGEAKNALDIVKNNRQASYRSQLEKIKNVEVGANLESIKKNALDNLKNYGIKLNPEDGALDFSRSKIADQAEANRLREVLQNVFDWGTQEGDNTVLGLDTLKQRLDDFYSPSSQVRTYVSTLRKEVADSIKKAVPEYSDMTKGYQEATKLIDDIQSGLSLGDKAKPDTAIRKLTSVLRENNEHRRELLAALEEASGGANMAGKVAGAQLSAILPRGVTSRILGSLGTAGAYLNPSMIPALATASPRVVGEFVNALGKAYRATNKEPVKRVIKGTAAQLNK